MQRKRCLNQLVLLATVLLIACGRPPTVSADQLQEFQIHEMAALADCIGVVRVTRLVKEHERRTFGPPRKDYAFEWVAQWRRNPCLESAEDPSNTCFAVLDNGWVRPGEEYLVFLERTGPGEYWALREDAKCPFRELHPDGTLDWARSWVVAAEMAGEDWSAKVLTLPQAKRIIEIR